LAITLGEWHHCHPGNVSGRYGQIAELWLVGTFSLGKKDNGCLAVSAVEWLWLFAKSKICGGMMKIKRVMVFLRCPKSGS